MRHPLMMTALATLLTCCQPPATTTEPPQLTPHVGEPVPTALAGKTQMVAQCLKVGQAKSDYNDIRGKYLFDGPPPASALKNKNTPTAHEQDVLKKWAAERGVCDLQDRDLIEYLAHIDPTYRTAYDIYQDQISETLHSLYDGRISYGVALKIEAIARNQYVQDLQDRNQKYQILSSLQVPAALEPGKASGKEPGK